MTTHYQSRLAFWRLKFGPRGEDLARLNAEADAMAAHRLTDDYKRKRAEWLEFIAAGRALIESGIPGIVVR